MKENQTPVNLTPSGTCTDRRQEAKEEVVKGKGYVNATPFTQRTYARHPLAHRLRVCDTTCFPDHHLDHPPDSAAPRQYVRTWDVLYRELPLTSATVKDKAQHAVVLDKQTSDKLNKDVQSYRLITVATLVDRLKINGSLARQALNDLEEKGTIRKVVGHSKLSIYSTFHSPGS
jgi:small subunit ribosomal protein S25e